MLLPVSTMASRTDLASVFAIFAIILQGVWTIDDPCLQRYYNYESFVCVCNASYCDFLTNVDTPGTGNFTRIVSSRDAYRFGVFSSQMSGTNPGNITILLNQDYRYQSVLGFGGAFTDSTGINVVTLSEEAQNVLMRAYFAPEGLRYSLCRIPIAGSDFSTHAYSYDDVDGDVDLQFWSLVSEDFLYKLPLIQQAMDLSDSELVLFGSPWAPPAWMKTNGMANGTGGLLRDLWDSYSNYLVKFVEAYESYNLTIWGITPQNEPLTGFQDWAWNTCAWTPEDMRDWIKTSMGPIFGQAGLRRVNVMVLDHNRDALPWFPATIFEDPDANQYVDGTAVHWYSDDSYGPEVLTETVAEFPDKFLLYTEACAGFYGDLSDRVHLGEWQRAENYASDIIDDLNHYSVGFVDWNMALDTQGGPNWANNYVDSPVIINATSDEFYKQPTFYAMGHFSKFISRDAQRIYANVLNEVTVVKATAFQNPDGTLVVVILNTEDAFRNVSIEVSDGIFANFIMEPKSLETVIISN